MLNSGINFSFTIAMVTKVDNKICLNREFSILKVSKVAKIRNRYNQVPHLTKDTNGKVINSQKTPQTRAKRSALSQQVTTKHINRRAQNIANTRQNKNIKDPQKKYRLGTVSKIFKPNLSLFVTIF